MTHQPSFPKLSLPIKEDHPPREIPRAHGSHHPVAAPTGGHRTFLSQGQRGRPPVGLERMLRVYFLQQWYGLADEALEDALYDSQALRGFARIELAAEGVPDATTLLKFRRLLEPTTCAKASSPPSRRPHRARPAAARRHTGGRHAHRRAALHQEQGKAARPEMHQTRKGQHGILE